MKAAIIGSGMAGLTAAAALAQQGHSVTVFEQADHIGGVTASYEKDGFRWDLGQLLVEGFGPGEPVGTILHTLQVDERIRIRRDDRGYVFPDFEIRKPKIYSGPLWRLDRLKQLFPKDERGLRHYWRDYLRFTRIMTAARTMEATSGLTRWFWKARLYANLLPFLPRKDWTATQLMNSYFRTRQLQMVFISILADFFTPPSKFQGLGVFALNPESSFDCRIPRRIAPGAELLYQYSLLGGAITLVTALAEKIREHGGEILTSRPIARILVNNGRATGVVDALGNAYPADVVIASGGAKETFFNLVGKGSLPEPLAADITALPLMDSVFMVHLGLDTSPAEYVHGACTYFYGTYDLEGGIDRAKRGEYHEGKDGFVVHVPTLHSPEMAPQGMHAVTIYTICPDRLRDGAWANNKEFYADRLVAAAERYIPGLREHTRVREILTPDDFRERTHTAHHAFGGTAPLMNAPKIRHQTPIMGLWFIGAQSESGGGVNNVISGAYATAQRIMQAGR